MKENSTTSIIEHIKIFSVKKNNDGKEERVVVLSKRDNKGVKNNLKKTNK